MADDVRKVPQEREVGVWIDGKPLYEKTIQFSSNLSSSGIYNHQHGIPNIDLVTDLFGFGYTQSGNTYPINNGRNGNLLGAWANSTYVSLYIGNNDLWSGDWTVTLRYTKTTDAPGQGLWAGNGAMAHHYSTDEVIVGTWIDGKPLYEKTIYIASVTSGTSYQHNISNVKDISIYEIRAKRNTGWYSSGHIFQDSMNKITESFSVIPSSTALYAYLFGNTITDCYVTVRYTKTTD